MWYMRMSTYFGSRTLGFANGRRVIFARVYHKRFSTSLGAWAKCKSPKLDVLENDDDWNVVGKGWFQAFQPNPLFYIDLLKESAEIGCIRDGRMVHAHVLKSEYKDGVEINNTIVYMYSKCGSVFEAQKVFDEMPARDTFTWTALIIAYSQNGIPEKALSLFPQMLHLGCSFCKPNKFTFSSLLKASGGVSTYKYGMHMHAICIKYGYDSSLYVGAALVDMYVRYGFMNDAQLIFDGLLTKNEVSWNALIAGHARKDERDKALSVFRRMKREAFEPDDFTYSSLLKTCASNGGLDQGKWIHVHVIKSGMKLANFVGDTLLHMYAKCGSIEDAEKVFNRLTNRTVVSWNSMLTAYSQYGLAHKSLGLFDGMLKTGKIQPNEITFLCLLTACSHAGLVEEGRNYLNMMKLYGLDPWVDHYVAVVDLLGRAGKLNEALTFIKHMPIEPVAEIWKALLSACKLHRNTELAVYAAERVFELDPYDSGPYVILSNVYASAGRKADVAKVRMMMKECGIRKEPACSWVEIENVVHVFVAGDHAHPQIKKIYCTWENIISKIKEIGYVPDTSQVLLFIDDLEKDVNLQHHSEKLALAFAVLNTPIGSTICIKKNIRICADCHSAFKFASRVIKREIVVRDKKRFHHFQNGSCSCGDFW